MPPGTKCSQWLASAPEQMKMQQVDLLSNHQSDQQAWELTFEVEQLHDLQKVLRHFDRSAIDYEFYLDF